VAIGGATFDFATNPPPVGMIFGLLGPAVKVTSTTVEAANKGTNGTLTYRGMSNGVPIFDINIPAINLNATNVRADGSLAPASTGGSALLGLKVLKYTAQGAWGYTTGGGLSYAGVAASGSGTPIANVPTSGAATYSGINGTVGIYFVPSGAGAISSGALSGDITINVNFGTGAVCGLLSNMTATPVEGGAATPWNNVSLSANIKRLTDNASFTGTTSANGAPSGAGNAGFSSAAAGDLGGAFFGPNADEAGGTWTLTEPGAAGGGKTAFGAFGAASNGCSNCATGVSIAAPGMGLSSFGGASVGSSFTTDPPPVGTKISLTGGGTAAITPISFAEYKADQILATYRGTVTNGGVTYPVFDLSVPSLSLTASNVRGDGTVVTLADGGKVSATASTMSYTFLGAWNYTPVGGDTSYLGQVVTGYGTPPASVPTSGSAAYTGTGTVFGAYAVPSGTNAIEIGTLNGDVSLNVDFANNTATGSFTNMKAQAAGSSTATPWNDVSLSGTFHRGPTSVTMSGPTSTTTNTGPAGFSSAAHGSFTGALYGPAAQEAAGGWNLSESIAGGGKAAFGTFGAHQ
jgi:hypothetical protein